MVLFFEVFGGHDRKKLSAACRWEALRATSASRRAISLFSNSTRAFSSSTDSMERSVPISWAVFFCGRSSSIKLIGSPPFAAESMMAKNTVDAEGKSRPIRPKPPMS
ncbi:hypothetical protein RHECNPAF_770078 [Rhizobium etli CNPAF512]|nr:hypothetical protein RHECNPAF_770078 [Rhizobium etli CNPAF512]